MRNILCPLAFSAAVSMSSLAFGSTAFAQDLDVSFTDRGGMVRPPGAPAASSLALPRMAMGF